MNNELVFLSSKRMDAEPFTTADVIAKYAGISHPSINRIITTHLDRLTHFGKVRFKITPLPSGQKTKVYELNEQQSTLLITFLKNTPRVADFKEELVRQFFEMRRLLLKQQVSFELGKRFSKDLGKAIANSPHLDEHGHFFTNANKLIYKQALGVSTTRIRKERHIPKSEPITHYLSSQEAAAVHKVKNQVITLVELQFDYDAVKRALQSQGVVYQIQLPVRREKLK